MFMLFKKQDGGRERRLPLRLNISKPLCGTESSDTLLPDLLPLTHTNTHTPCLLAHTLTLISDDVNSASVGRIRLSWLVAVEIVPPSSLLITHRCSPVFVQHMNACVCVRACVSDALTWQSSEHHKCIQVEIGTENKVFCESVSMTRYPLQNFVPRVWTQTSCSAFSLIYANVCEAHFIMPL